MSHQHRAAAHGGDAAVAANSKQPPAQAPVSNQDVVLYMTLNNTTHDKDELPESLAALDAGEQEGLGDWDLLPISDPYATKKKDGSLEFDQGTYANSMGTEGAGRIQWWHGDPELQPGQVRIGDEIISLGTDNVDMKDAAQAAKVTEGWRKTLAASGMDAEHIDASVAALFQKDGEGNLQGLGSGDGATNELVQYMMAMYRAEKGEINVKSIVLSGHHWRGTETGEAPNDRRDREGGHGIWGEVPGGDHQYDNASDFFSLVDVGNLKSAFPKAYSQVKSVQLAACNTDALGIAGADGTAQTTNEFLQGTFENVEMTSYWKETLAPLAASGFASNGEFLLDAMRLESGDVDAAKDARMNPKGLKRSLLTEDGSLEEISMRTNKKSYGASQGVGLKGTSKKAYDERTDLADHLYTAPTLAETDLSKKPEPEKEAAPAEEPSLFDQIWKGIFGG